MKPLALIIFVLGSSILMAFEDLGPLKTAQSQYPQIFKAGSVNIISVNNIPCYVFSGDAEQAFSGEFAETASELYEEATLAAKSNFYEFLSSKDKKVTVSMTGCKVLYQYNDKKIYNVILFVPRANVSIKHNKTNIGSESKKINDPAASSGKPEEKTSSAAVAPKAATASAAVAPKAAASSAADAPKAAAATSQAAQVIAQPAPSPQSSRERRIERYRNRIKNDPADTFALIRLGDLYQESENFSEAVKFYCSAIKQIEKDKFFDETEKIRVIYNVANLFEKNNKYNMALKYYHYLLRHKCSDEQKKNAVAAISKLRLKTLN